MERHPRRRPRRLPARPGGRRGGRAPLLYPGVDPAFVTDPLPQAITLTAIVITLATTAFILAMA
ncbi:hypothetical protein CLM85_22165, partial [Streptomyces albidoflavus]